jgi:glycosyltransferase involved in cell wall biosynthesis
MPKLIRITTVPLSLNVLLRGQMRYMQENDFDVVMVSSDGEELDTVKHNEGCRHKIIPMTRSITPFADIISLWNLYRFFKKEKPDIVHSHTPKAGLLSMIAAKLAGIKIRIHTIAGLRFMTSTGLTRKILIFMEKLTANAATHVWPNSSSLLKYIGENRLVKKEKLTVIGLGSSNGINLERYSPSSLQTDLLEKVKKQMHYEEGKTYLLSVGRIVKDKGIEELVQVFDRLYSENNSLRLILLGAFEDDLDPVSDETKSILQNHPAILHVPWSDIVEYFMYLSDLLVHPSHREGFPNVLLQAGAMGCPIVCSAIEGNIDIVKEGETGYLFKVKNKQELFSQLKKALSNKDLCKQFAKNLRKVIEENYNQSVVHEKIRAEYQKILSSKLVTHDQPSGNS